MRANRQKMEKTLKMDYKNIDKEHKEQLIKTTISEYANNDLEKYAKALDKCVCSSFIIFPIANLHVAQSSSITPSRWMRSMILLVIFGTRLIKGLISTGSELSPIMTRRRQVLVRAIIIEWSW